MSDPRQERSRTAIAEAFDELLREKSYSAITVADIIGRAHVGRATFYAHFRNKDELLASRVNKVCGHAVSPAAPEARCDPESPSSPQSQVEHVLVHLLEDRDGLAALVTGEGSERFADCLRHEVVERALASMPAEPEGPAARMDRSFLAHHVAASFVGAVRWWAWHGFAATPHDLACDYLRAILPLFAENSEQGL